MQRQAASLRPFGNTPILPTSIFADFFIVVTFSLSVAFRNEVKMTSYPTIILVPGAFHVGSALDLLSSELNAAGYDTKIFGLVTVDQSKLAIKDDVVALTEEVFLPLIEQQGKDIVLYLHSYAGFPGSAAIKGLSKTERLAVGKRGGILGLVYQSAFIPRPGASLLEMVGGSYRSWQKPDVLPTR